MQEDAALALVRRLIDAHPDDLAPSLVRTRRVVLAQQDQRSTEDQLRDLVVIGTLLGLKDAADCVRHRLLDK